MRITRKTIISLISERKFTARTQTTAENEKIFCLICSAEMIPAQISADFFRISSREIYRLIEADEIHFVETERNEIYVCPASIEKTTAMRTR